MVQKIDFYLVADSATGFALDLAETVDSAVEELEANVVAAVVVDAVVLST